jgi:hypothetical protein
MSFLDTYEDAIRQNTNARGMVPKTFCGPLVMRLLSVLGDPLIFPGEVEEARRAARLLWSLSLAKPLGNMKPTSYSAALLLSMSDEDVFRRAVLSGMGVINRMSIACNVGSYSCRFPDANGSSGSFFPAPDAVLPDELSHLVCGSTTKTALERSSSGNPQIMRTTQILSRRVSTVDRDDDGFGHFIHGGVIADVIRMVSPEKADAIRDGILFAMGGVGLRRVEVESGEKILLMPLGDGNYAQITPATSVATASRIAPLGFDDAIRTSKIKVGGTQPQNISHIASAVSGDIPLLWGFPSDPQALDPFKSDIAEACSSRSIILAPIGQSVGRIASLRRPTTVNNAVVRAAMDRRVYSAVASMLRLFREPAADLLFRMQGSTVPVIERAVLVSGWKNVGDEGRRLFAERVSRKLVQASKTPLETVADRRRLEECIEEFMMREHRPVAGELVP